MRINPAAVSDSNMNQKIFFVKAAGLCSARHQAGILRPVGCPPEGGRYINPDQTNAKREYDLAMPIPEEAQR